MKEPKEHLVLPLDVNTTDLALSLVKKLKELVGVFKVGLELFVSEGPAILKEIKELSGAKVFLDLKLNDIPETVSRAIKAALKYEIDFLTIHPDEAQESLKKLDPDLRQKVKILGVTILTSLNTQKVRRLGYSEGLDIPSLVRKRADVLAEAGVDGFVCSGKEIEALRRPFPEAVLVVPGIRPLWSLVEGEDQSRIITPKEAILKGADYIVVGRPILRAPDPIDAAQKVLEEIEEGLSWRYKTFTK